MILDRLLASLLCFFKNFILVDHDVVAVQCITSLRFVKKPALCADRLYFKINRKNLVHQAFASFALVLTGIQFPLRYFYVVSWRQRRKHPVIFALKHLKAFNGIGSLIQFIFSGPIEFLE
jgi:hypothetical protein